MKDNVQVLQAEARAHSPGELKKQSCSSARATLMLFMVTNSKESDQGGGK